jgi:hypothetical protein
MEVPGEDPRRIIEYKCGPPSLETEAGAQVANKEESMGHPVPAYVALVTVVISMFIATFLNYATVVARCFALMYLFFTGALVLYLIGSLWFEGHSAAAWLTFLLLIVLELAVLIPLGLSHEAAKLSAGGK